MARKSRKNAAAEPIQMPVADRIYKAGLYARISVETERKREADTIGNQLQLLRDYVSEHSDLSVFDIYSDDDIFSLLNSKKNARSTTRRLQQADRGPS